MNFFESLERIKEILYLYKRYEEQKQTYIKRGLEIKNLERTQNNLLEELKELVGERSIEKAQQLLLEHGVE